MKLNKEIATEVVFVSEQWPANIAAAEKAKKSITINVDGCLIDTTVEVGRKIVEAVKQAEERYK